jgi:hypothetical protein
MDLISARTRYRRAGKASPAMIGTLIVAILVVGGYWGYRWVAARNASAPEAARGEYYLSCTECDEVITLAGAEAQGREKQNGMVLCPKCGKFAGTWVESPQKAEAKKHGLAAP